MDGRGPLTGDGAYKKLQEFYDKTGKNIKIADEFKSDANRFSNFR